ncbi:GlcG/HbpS family heme-binding protein [Streptomyces sp. NPDC002144]|uniref:GlcG/HbpS family heme-binding protein n=1 Tax=Streptomyces sp. NPDC001351 TaxID=3364564 RepID=UPI0036D120EA
MRAPLTYEAARAAADAVLTAGRAEGLHLAVAVVDRGGITRILLADDGAGPIAIETARRKAYTSAVTGFTTTVFAQFAASPQMAAVPQHTIDANLLPAPGGLPITVDDSEVIGGIGVGGADGETDDRIAATALKSIADLLA